MIQLFFISLEGSDAFLQAMHSIGGIPTHGTHWANDHDPNDRQVVGVVEISKGDPDHVADALEAAGILVLPDHKGTETVPREHYLRLQRHGVLPTDTTKQAMLKVHASTGRLPLKPKRFS
jgi:hypothetical protein